MMHGIQGYFLEQRRFSRRTTAITLALAVVLLSGMLALRAGPVKTMVKDIPIVRFGYEGREQYVRRIELEARSGPSDAALGLESVVIPAARQGGATAKSRQNEREAIPEVRPLRDREGGAEADRIARAARRLMDVPLVRSEELVIEHLVKPVYPEDAVQRGLEGRVAVLALVDTLGQIASVEVIDGVEAGLLEQAAAEAVWKCRFRPYRIDGRTLSVYAMFRFNFDIN